MGMFDTVNAELTCPFCGREYRHAPLSWEQAEQECREEQAQELKILAGEERFLGMDMRKMQPRWAERDGFKIRDGEGREEDLLAWIEYLASPQKIEKWRTRPELGLAQIQTKAFDSVLDKLFVGNPVPVYPGHYFIRERFHCKGCSSVDERVSVAAWLEIEAHKIQAVLTHNPETGEPEREIFSNHPSAVPMDEPGIPDLHPIYKEHTGRATWDEARGFYRGKLVRFAEDLVFAGKDAVETEAYFQQVVDDYLNLCERWRQFFEKDFTI